MNLPNRLTMFRVIMVPVILAVLCVPLPLSDTAVRIIAAAIFAVTSLTDMLDGKIARKYNLITDFGKFLDPLADKLLVITAMLGILVRFEYLRSVYVWALFIVFLRELAVTSLRMVASNKSGLVIAAGWLGKIKTCTQMFSILCILLEPVILPFEPFRSHTPVSFVSIAVMAVMTLWSGIDYLIQYWPVIDPKQ